MSTTLRADFGFIAPDGVSYPCVSRKLRLAVATATKKSMLCKQEWFLVNGEAIVGGSRMLGLFHAGIVSQDRKRLSDFCTLDEDAAIRFRPR